jgi:hypothetical protein
LFTVFVGQYGNETRSNQGKEDDCREPREVIHRHDNKKKYLLVVALIILKFVNFLLTFANKFFELFTLFFSME